MLKISQLEEIDRWIEKSMKYCWGAIIIIVLLEGLVFFAFGIINDEQWKDNLANYILSYILFPTIRNVMIVGLGSIGVRMYLKSKKRIAMYLSSITISLMSMNLIYTHHNILVLIGLLGVPITLSIIAGDKKFTDNISLLNGLLLLFIQIKIVQYNDLSIELTVLTLISSAIVLFIIHKVSKSLLEYYGNVLACWSMASEVLKIEPLTGVLCKKAISNELQELVEEVSGGSLSIALIDIDNMKNLNQTYGRENGDEIIRTLSRTIKRCSNNEIKVGRYGEDEFLMVFDSHGVMQVITVCELIRDTFYQQTIETIPRNTFSVSIGIATLTHKTRDSIELLIKGKEALKKAKESGKNKTVVS